MTAAETVKKSRRSASKPGAISLGYLGGGGWWRYVHREMPVGGEEDSMQQSKIMKKLAWHRMAQAEKAASA
jgi:hypothetical protein